MSYPNLTTGSTATPPNQVPTGEDFLSWQNLQANFSALMYLLTEQQALFGRLLEELLKGGQLDSVQLEKITQVYGDGEVLNSVYLDLHKRYSTYFSRVKDILANPSLNIPTVEEPTGN